MRTIKARYKQAKVQWLRKPGESVSRVQAEESKESSAVSARPAAVNASEYDIENLKHQLIENGLPEELLAMLSANDIIENAKAMRIIPE